jgi:Flp pilus assembly protein TadD
MAFRDALIRNHEPEQAITQLQRAVTLKPDIPEAHAALARTLAGQGKKTEAEWHYHETLRLLKAQKQAVPSEHGMSQ